MVRQRLPDIHMAVLCPLLIWFAIASEPFGEGSSRTPSDLTPTAQVLDAIMRRTLLPRMGYREGLTRIQLWLLNSLMQQTVFDIWDLLLSEMEDTIAEGLRGHRQLPYAH